MGRESDKNVTFAMLALRQARRPERKELNRRFGGSATDEDLECSENLFEFTVIQSNALQ